MKSVTFQKLELARQFWLEHSLDKYDYILLLPDMDNALNEKILSFLSANLNRIINVNGISKAKVFVISTTMLDANSYFTMKKISQEMMEGFIALYSLYKFTDKLIIGSFDLPHGRKIKNLLNSGVATEEKLIEIILRQN